MCWQNKRLNDHTWNPLDNVCMGNDRYDDTNVFDGTQEKCSTYGYCSKGTRDRDTEDTCGSEEDWLDKKKDMEVAVWPKYQKICDEAEGRSIVMYKEER